MSGIVLSWGRCRKLYVDSRIGGRRRWSTWCGLWRMAANNLLSAASHSSIMVGWSHGSKPCFCILVMIAWRRYLLPSSSKPQPEVAGICHSCHNGSPGNIPQMGATEPLGPKCPDGIESLVTLSNHTFNMFPECKILLIYHPQNFHRWHSFNPRCGRWNVT